MEKVLFISSFIGAEKTGGSIAAHSNLRLCKNLFEEKQVDAYGFAFRKVVPVDGIKYLPSYRSAADTFASYLSGYSGGLTKNNFSDLKEIIDDGDYNVVFLDGSLLGGIAKYIKEKSPASLCLVFFHNLERDYFKAMYARKPAYFPVIRSATKNERLAAESADLVFVFNERDASLIKKIYHRTADEIFPITVEDAWKNSTTEKKQGFVRLLFIGSNFQANIDGIKWFADNVMPQTNAMLTVIGKNMQELRGELDKTNIHVLGTVDDLHPHYEHADAVVAPIFSGSGMKVKTAEALMMGKTVIGTNEAWEGYNEAARQTGVVCNTAQEFLNAIEKITDNSCSFNAAARKVYEQFYSPTSQREKIQSVTKRLQREWKFN